MLQQQRTIYFLARKTILLTIFIIDAIDGCTMKDYVQANIR